MAGAAAGFSPSVYSPCYGMQYESRAFAGTPITRVICASNDRPTRISGGISSECLYRFMQGSRNVLRTPCKQRVFSGWERGFAVLCFVEKRGPRSKTRGPALRPAAAAIRATFSGCLLPLLPDALEPGFSEVFGGHDDPVTSSRFASRILLAGDFSPVSAVALHRPQGNASHL